MNRRRLIWALPLLVSCSGEAPQNSGETLPPELKPLAWLQDADAGKDAQKALAAQDHRLLAISGRGTMIPGIKNEDKAKAEQQCGLRYMEGMGDVIANKEHRKWWQRGKEYAKVYNAIVSEQCLK